MLVSSRQSKSFGALRRWIRMGTLWNRHGKLSMKSMKPTQNTTGCNNAPLKNQNNMTIPFSYPGNLTDKSDKKLLGHCIPGCVDYEFDHSFWVSTMITEWDLVCERSWLKTLAKLLLFTGWFLFSHCFSLGTLVSFLILNLPTM